MGELERKTDVSYLDYKEYASSSSEASAINRAIAYFPSYDNNLPGQSVRTPYNRSDYEAFRPSEALPKKYKDVIKAIDNVYYTMPIVRNMIDLMSDFASEGISISHPNKSVEKFYKEWFEKIDAKDRSERFLSGLYRHGMIVIRKYNGKLKNKKRGKFSLSEEINLRNKKIFRNQIPLKYVFFDPSLFEHTNYHKVNEYPKYTYKLPNKNNLGLYNSSNSPEEHILDSNKVYVDYYKKDDIKSKPVPFLYPILKHAMMIEKLSLADASALDGAISKVRIFKLGDLEKDIWPSATTIESFESLLSSNVGGGSLDIVAGPDVEMIESDTDIHKFLGQEKYVPHISQVYEGLGIPTSFTGVGQGTTNNYISLKILTRRLMSGREKLIKFWNEQIKEVQLAMGFSSPAILEFNNLDLGDEESERRLLLQLVDRDIISEEKVRNVLGYNKDLENERIKKESKERKSGKKPDKASQFHSPDKEFTVKKIALDKGIFGPEHVGVFKNPGTENIPAPNSIDNSVNLKEEVKKGGSGGRPPGSKDKEKRKTPEFKPKIKASLDIWLAKTQNIINANLKEPYLKYKNKKNLRNLTSNDIQEFENLKFGVLSNIKPYEKINKDRIISLLSVASKADFKVLDKKIEEIKEEFGSISLEDIKILHKHMYIESNYENL